MSVKDFLAPLFIAVPAFALGAIFGVEHAPPSDEPHPSPPTVAEFQTERQERCEECGGECMCGDTQTCPFGPGIVGQQKCQSSFFRPNKWGRCEPVPVVDEEMHRGVFDVKP